LAPGISRIAYLPPRRSETHWLQSVFCFAAVLQRVLNRLQRFFASLLEKERSQGHGSRPVEIIAKDTLTGLYLLRTIFLFVVLQRRGAKIYCEFLGGSFTSDAHHMTDPHPEGNDFEGSKMATLFWNAMCCQTCTKIEQLSVRVWIMVWKAFLIVKPFPMESRSIHSTEWL
jgi:hypothetical protein